MENGVNGTEVCYHSVGDQWAIMSVVSEIMRFTLCVFHNLFCVMIKKLYFCN